MVPPDACGERLIGAGRSAVSLSDQTRSVKMRRSSYGFPLTAPVVLLIKNRSNPTVTYRKREENKKKSTELSEGAETRSLAAIQFIHIVAQLSPLADQGFEHPVEAVSGHRHGIEDPKVKLVLGNGLRGELLYCPVAHAAHRPAQTVRQEDSERTVEAAAEGDIRLQLARDDLLVEEQRQTLADSRDGCGRR